MWWSLTKKDIIVFLLAGIQDGSGRGRWNKPFLLGKLLLRIVVILPCRLWIPFPQVLSLHWFLWISRIHWLSFDRSGCKTFHSSLRSYFPQKRSYGPLKQTYWTGIPISSWLIGSSWRILISFIAAIQATHNVVHIDRGWYAFPVSGPGSGNYLFIGHKVIPLLGSHRRHSLKWFGKVTLI